MPASPFAKGGRSILFVGPGFGTAQKALYWGVLWSAIARSGTAVGVASFRDTVPSDVGADITFHNLKSLIGSLATAFNVRRQYNIYVLNEFSLLTLLWAALLNAVGRRQAMVLLVENHPRYLEGYGKTRDNRFHRLYRKIALLFFTRAIVNNDETARYLAQLTGASFRITVGAYLTSDFSQHPKRGRQGTPGIKHGILIGQLIPRKGFEQLISEVGKNQDWIRGKFVFSIYGAGEKQTDLQRQLERDGVGDIVKLAGTVPYHEIPIVLDQGDFFIAPTLADYRSLVSFEALSLGLPLVISERDGACGEVVNEAWNGYKYDPLAAGDLQRVLLKLWERRAEFDQLSANSAARSASFTTDSAVALFTELDSDRGVEAEAPTR